MYICYILSVGTHSLLFIKNNSPLEGRVIFLRVQMHSGKCGGGPPWSQGELDSAANSQVKLDMARGPAVTCVWMFRVIWKKDLLSVSGGKKTNKQNFQVKPFNLSRFSPGLSPPPLQYRKKPFSAVSRQEWKPSLNLNSRLQKCSWRRKKKTKKKQNPTTHQVDVFLIKADGDVTPLTWS